MGAGSWRGMSLALPILLSSHDNILYYTTPESNLGGYSVTELDPLPQSDPVGSEHYCITFLVRWEEASGRNLWRMVESHPLGLRATAGEGGGSPSPSMGRVG